MARELAWQQADDAQRERAKLCALDPDERSRKLAVSAAEVDQDRLTYLLRILAGTEQLAASVRHIWQSPNAQEILHAETATGWPAEYA